MQFQGEKIFHIGTTVVVDGVICEAYSFAEDDTKDLGIVTIQKGHKTPR